MFQKELWLYSAPIIWVITITLLLTMATAASGNEFKFKWQAYKDLNGDGSKEKISLHKDKSDSSKFTLKIGRHQISGQLGDEVYGFAIIDIQKADKYFEVAVYTPGPSDDDEYMIFWYNGQKIAQVGHISRWPTFKGNGIVYVKGWMDFWKVMHKYALVRNHRLKMVHQPFYYVGIKTRIKKGRNFIIHLNPQHRAVAVANLIPGSKIELLVAKIKESGEAWYLVKSTSGLIGWAYHDIIVRNVANLPLAD